MQNELVKMKRVWLKQEQILANGLRKISLIQKKVPQTFPYLF